jgi:regulator of sigma E protease
MLDGRVDTLSVSDEPFAFDKKNVWQRIAIVSAGPAANFLLAVIVFFLMYMIGISSAKPIMKGTVDNTPMSIIKSDGAFQIVAVNEQQVGDWEALNLALVSQIGESDFKITIVPATTDKNHFEPSRTFTVSLENWVFEPKKTINY